MLTKLNANFCSMSDEAVSMMSLLTRLKSLSLELDFTSKFDVWLSALVQLEELLRHLDQTQISFRALAGLTKLRCLSVSGGNICDDDARLFANLSNLCSLRLIRSNVVTDTSVREFVD